MEKMLDALSEGLGEISLGEQDVFIKQDKSVRLCIVALTELKTLILKKGFRTKREEIRFFKTIKPRFESQLKYHAALFDVEKHKPAGSIQMQVLYLQKKLEEINILMKSDLEFYTYYKTGSEYYDEIYFTRCTCPVQLAIQANLFDIDINFGTSHSHRVSQLLAYEMLGKYLNSTIESISGKNSVSDKPADARQKLTWQASKAALIELIYALNSNQVFGNQHAEIKEIVNCFETMFNIQLGDCYSTFRDIRERKSGRTKFLDCIKESLIRQMDYSEEITVSSRAMY